MPRGLIGGAYADHFMVVIQHHEGFIHILHEIGLPQSRIDLIWIVISRLDKALDPGTAQSIIGDLHPFYNPLIGQPAEIALPPLIYLRFKSLHLFRRYVQGI